MQRISVDFPDPEGPQITIRSPAPTERLTSLRAWNSPNHFPRPTIEMISGFASGRLELTVMERWPVAGELYEFEKKGGRVEVVGPSFHLAISIGSASAPSPDV